MDADEYDHIHTIPHIYTWVGVTSLRHGVRVPGAKSVGVSYVRTYVGNFFGWNFGGIAPC